MTPAAATALDLSRRPLGYMTEVDDAVAELLDANKITLTWVCRGYVIIRPVPVMVVLRRKFLRDKGRGEYGIGLPAS
jgi:hypothetical protein